MKKTHWTVFTRALVRAPTANFAQGLTQFTGGPPDFAAALDQHGRYCQALAGCGLDIIHLLPDERFADATFVEDTAVITPRGAVLTRPGAPTRLGETESVAQALAGFFPELLRILPPGLVDGGDVCEAEGRYLIGVSARTNEAGARQLKDHLGRLGHAATLVDIRSSRTLLHLKTGIAYLGDDMWALAPDIERELPPLGDLGIRHRITVLPAEAYAANCVRVNESILAAAGHPRFLETLESRGFRTVVLDMSEFQKMDGGLSCLSLRF